MFNRKLKAENAELKKRLADAEACLESLGCHLRYGVWFKQEPPDPRFFDKMKVLLDAVTRAVATQDVAVAYDALRGALAEYRAINRDVDAQTIPGFSRVVRLPRKPERTCSCCRCSTES